VPRFRLTPEQIAEDEKFRAEQEAKLRAGNATVQVWSNPASPGYPRVSYNIDVRNPLGGLINGSFGFDDFDVALDWGKGVAKGKGYLNPIIDNKCQH
jgi:hypothetical protein